MWDMRYDFHPISEIPHPRPLMNYQLIGDATQALLVHLQPGEGVSAEAGAMIFCNDAVRFETRMQAGLAGGIKRIVAGDHPVLTHFECTAPGGVVAFAAPYAGKIHTLELNGNAKGGNNWFCQRDSLLCATTSVSVETAWMRRFGAGLFGGEGFILQKLGGSGTAWVHIGGNVVESELAAGQKMHVDAGCIACFESTVRCDIEFRGGFKNALFGGEGIWLAVLEGPGKVMLQTLPLARVAGRLHGAQTSGVRTSPGGSSGDTAFGDIGSIIGP